MYEISAHFISYLRIETLLESTQTANAAISTAPTGKKQSRTKYPRLHNFIVFFSLISGIQDVYVRKLFYFVQRGFVNAGVTRELNIVLCCLLLY